MFFLLLSFPIATALSPTPTVSPLPRGGATVCSAAMCSPAPETADRLMAASAGSHDTYLGVVFATLGVGLHAIVPCGSLSGVLLDGAITMDLGLEPQQAALGDAALLFAWAPGALLGGPVSDQAGRKPASLGFGVGTALAVGAMAVLPVDRNAFAALIVARAAAGFCIGGLMSAAYTLVVESVDASRRGRASFSWSLGYVGGIVLLAGLHYAAQHAPVSLPIATWRLEELLCASFGLLFAVLTQLVVLETPAFHLSNGNAAGALATARKIARWNGADVALDAALEHDPALAGLALLPPPSPPPPRWTTPTTMALSTEAQVEQQPGAQWSDLFDPAGLLGITLTLGAIQFAWNGAYYMLNFSAGALTDALLVNFVLLGMVELPGAAVAGAATEALGARRTAVLFLGAAGVTLCTLALLQSSGQAAEHANLAVGLSLLGKSLTAGIFTAVFLLTTELHPTELRTAAIGCGMCFGKIGASAAPPLSTMVPLPMSLGTLGATLLIVSAAATTLPSDCQSAGTPSSQPGSM